MICLAELDHFQQITQFRHTIVGKPYKLCHKTLKWNLQVKHQLVHQIRHASKLSQAHLERVVSCHEQIGEYFAKFPPPLPLLYLAEYSPMHDHYHAKIYLFCINHSGNGKLKQEIFERLSWITCSLAVINNYFGWQRLTLPILDHIKNLLVLIWGDRSPMDCPPLNLFNKTIRMYEN